MNFKLLLFVFLAFLPCLSYSYRLSGVITDENKESIPYTTVFIKNTTIAVSSNIKGEYQMQLENGIYDIVYYCFGYQKKEIKVTINGANKVIDVNLVPEVNNLSEVVVSENKEDPAYQIIRNAIKVKDKYKVLAEAYSYKAYIKSSLVKEYLKKGSLDSLKKDSVKKELTKERMNFLESYSTVYCQKPDKIKEVKEAYNDMSESNKGVSVSVSGFNDPDASKAGQEVKIDLFKTKISEADFNFYENLLLVPSLSKSPIVSPLHYATFLSYKFRLEESFYEDGKWVNKILVTPKRSDASLVSGYIYIVDSLWCIKSVDFTVDKATLNHFKFFRIIQNYSPLKNGKWALSQEEFFHDSKEGKQTNFGNTIIKYSEYNLNETFRNNFFNNEISVIVDDAYEKDSTYWAKIRPVTLKEDEIVFIKKIDSIQDYHKSPKYLKMQDSIVNKFHWYELLFGTTFQNNFKKQEIFVDGMINGVLNSLIPIGNIRPQTTIMYKKEFKRGYVIKPDFTLRYGIKNKDIRGNVGFSYTYLPKKFGRLYMRYENDYGAINQYQAISSTFLMSNYVNNIGYSAGHEIEIFNGAYLDIKGELLKKSPLNLALDEWASPDANTPQEQQQLAELMGTNFQAFNKFTFDITLKYTPFQKYYTEPYKKIIVGSKYPSLALNYRKGISGVFNSIANYDFIELRVWDDVRLGSFGESRWKVYTGKFINSASLQFTESKFFRKSDNGFFSNPLRSFQLLDTSLSTFKEYFQAHYMHNFEGKLLNKVPLIKRLHLTEAVGASVLYINDNNFKHIELYAGIEKPFHITKWKQRFKIGCYYVISDGNYSKVDGQIKFGISMFDPFTNMWVH